LVRSTGEGDLYQVPIYVRRPPRRWYRGVAVLLGDAAHGMGPALGQGGAQAFVDAVALRRSLERVIDIEDALRDYQRQRAGAILRLWVGSNITLRMRRTGLLELATRLTPARLAHRSFARSVAPDRQVLENLSPADPGP
jgi:2-polyprenyl-6-methoxyphenol hydroxylase-like FAD-dependent oxidoreductase